MKDLTDPKEAEFDAWLKQLDVEQLRATRSWIWRLLRHFLSR